MTARTDTLAKKKDAIRRFVSVVCGAWTYILDGHEQEGAEAVFAKKPNGAFSAAMIAFAAWVDREPGGVNYSGYALEMVPNLPLALG